MFSTLLVVLSLLAAGVTSRAPRARRSGISGPAAIVNLRIEGSTTTIYEGTIQDYPLTITTPSGGTHLCDGTNNGANPTPGPTCTGALAIASSMYGFTFDGTFDSAFDDYFITCIGPDCETATEFWGLLLDYQFTAVGGCQQEVSTGQDILWAFNAFNADYFLELSGPNEAFVGQPTTFTVIDGSSGTPIDGADLGGYGTTGAGGTGTITFSSPGTYTFKATYPDSIRSNALTVVVLP